MYWCLRWTAAPYLSQKFHWLTAVEARRRLCSASSSSSLVVRRTHLSTFSFCSGCSIPEGCGALPQNVTSAPSLTVFQETPEATFLNSVFRTAQPACLSLLPNAFGAENHAYVDTKSAFFNLCTNSIFLSTPSPLVVPLWIFFRHGNGNWNSLPPDIQSSSSLTDFRHRL